ncbi:hypothetical protein GCM10009693_08250 [Leucobacter chromiireducens subsp. chromiireducens]
MDAQRARGPIPPNHSVSIANMLKRGEVDRNGDPCCGPRRVAGNKPIVDLRFCPGREHNRLRVEIARIALGDGAIQGDARGICGNRGRKRAHAAHDIGKHQQQHKGHRGHS